MALMNFLRELLATILAKTLLTGTVPPPENCSPRPYHAWAGQPCPLAFGLPRNPKNVATKSATIECKRAVRAG
ncbi:MAG: hypothetical protein DMG97_26690, partial [Acidobacteria bacterium]